MKWYVTNIQHIHSCDFFFWQSAVDYQIYFPRLSSSNVKVDNHVCWTTWPLAPLFSMSHPVTDILCWRRQISGFWSSYCLFRKKIYCFKLVLVVCKWNLSSPERICSSVSTFPIVVSLDIADLWKMRQHQKGYHTNGIQRYNFSAPITYVRLTEPLYQAPIILLVHLSTPTLFP